MGGADYDDTSGDFKLHRRGHLGRPATDQVRRQSKLCLLDLIDVGAGGAGTKLSRIIRDYSALGHERPSADDV